MSELTPEERKAKRADILISIDAAYLGTVGGTRKRLNANDAEVKRLQAEIDGLRHESANIVDSSITAWNQAMTRLQMPVEGGAVVPWTHRITPDELLLAIGDDEYFCIYTTGSHHHFGPATESGHRSCYDSGCTAVVSLPKYDLGIIPPDLPENIRAALADLGAPGQ